MDSSYWFDTINLRGHRLEFPNKNCVSSSEDHFCLSNSVDPDEMCMGESSTFPKS